MYVYIYINAYHGNKIAAGHTAKHPSTKKKSQPHISSESHMCVTTWRCQLWALHIIKFHPPPAPPPCSVITPVHPPPSRYYGVAPTSRLLGLHLKVSFEKEPFFSGALLQTTLSNLERLQILATTHFNQTPRCVGCVVNTASSPLPLPPTHTLSHAYNAEPSRPLPPIKTPKRERRRMGPRVCTISS